MLRLRGSGSHSAPVPVPASAAIAQQPHSPWIGAERKEFYSSWHNVDKEKGKMMMMMILKIKIPGTPSPPRANDPRGRFSVIWDKTQRSSYCGFQSFQWHSGYRFNGTPVNDPDGGQSFSTDKGDASQHHRIRNELQSSK